MKMTRAKWFEVGKCLVMAGCIASASYFVSTTLKGEATAKPQAGDKLWMVLTTADGIGATWGPLPYDEKECEYRRDKRNASLAENIKSRKGEKGNDLPDEVVENLKHWKMSCVWNATRPTVAEK